MKKSKLFTCVVLLLCMLLPTMAFADEGSIVSLGADLSQTQRDDMLRFLVPDGTPMRIVTVTNQEERDLLGKYIPEQQIGKRSISCTSVKLLEAGKGITVSTHNISWVSASMYQSALITAGITDADVIVAAPFQVSGTAALTGIYKAYESAVGTSLAVEAKAVAGEELAITGQLGDLLGQEEAAALLAQLKEEILAQGLDNAESIRPAVREGATQLGIALTDDQVEMVTQLMLKIIKLDIDPKQLAGQVENLAKTIDTLLKAQETTNSFLQNVQKGLDGVVSWFRNLFK